MVKLLGGRAAAAVIGLFMLAVGSSAAAQDMKALGEIPAAVKATDSIKNDGATVAAKAAPALADGLVVPVIKAAVQPAANVSSAAATVNPKLAASIATEAAWLYKGGWPLYALVEKYSAGAPLDDQANCLATAVYFESRGESVEGQLAVARVVMNRAASGKYPPDWCSVVKQPWQFSFVRHGEFPAIDTGSAAWARAQGVARLAVANVVPSLGTDVLWYHANYVAPSWGRRLNMVERIGAHIFYRS